MSKTTTTIAAAALASALTLGVTAVPALALPMTQTEPVVVAQSEQIAPIDAIEAALDYFGIPWSHVDGTDWDMVDYDGHVCYEVRITEGLWVNDALGWLCGGNTYVAYVGAVTGDVYDGYVL